MAVILELMNWPRLIGPPEWLCEALGGRRA
jgi:hypothetical protein